MRETKKLNRKNGDKKRDNKLKRGQKQKRRKRRKRNKVKAVFSDAFLYLRINSSFFSQVQLPSSTTCYKASPICVPPSEHITSAHSNITNRHGGWEYQDK